MLIADLGVFRVSFAYPQYKLHSSIILNSSAIVYIKNNPTRFIELSPAIDKSFLYIRDDYILIVKYSIIKLIVQTYSYPEGKKIKLTKVIYIPTFYTSIALL